MTNHHRQNTAREHSEHMDGKTGLNLATLRLALYALILHRMPLPIKRKLSLEMQSAEL